MTTAIIWRNIPVKTRWQWRGWRARTKEPIKFWMNKVWPPAPCSSLWEVGEVRSHVSLVHWPLLELQRRLKTGNMKCGSQIGITSHEKGSSVWFETSDEEEAASSVWFYFMFIFYFLVLGCKIVFHQFLTVVALKLTEKEEQDSVDWKSVCFALDDQTMCQTIINNHCEPFYCVSSNICSQRFYFTSSGSSVHLKNWKSFQQWRLRYLCCRFDLCVHVSSETVSQLHSLSTRRRH